jgi:5'-nucleotidase
MKVLLSNDDGVHAEGLGTLHEVLSKHHQTTVIAPDRNCSGFSNALSLRTPLRIEEMKNGFFAVNGTPSDCVHLGVNAFLSEEPDLVVSGINHGPNLGDDVVYSGTVAAATEGRYMGHPAIAVSLAGHEGEHFESAARCTLTLMSYLDAHPLTENQILNVNVPDLPYEQIKGFKITRLGRRHPSESMVKALDPVGREIYWYGKLGGEADAGVGTDFDAVANGYCSVTPITVDMTDHNSIQQMKQWLEEK